MSKLKEHFFALVLDPDYVFYPATIRYTKKDCKVAASEYKAAPWKQLKRLGYRIAKCTFKELN